MNVWEHIPTDDDTKRRIWQLACTIRELQRETGASWISWRTIAKRQEGSEELDFVLQALAELPEAQPFFNIARNGKVVSLTQEGILLAASKLSEEPPLTNHVAQVVKRYAGRLRNLRFPIKQVQFIGKTQRRYVHAVGVEVGDAILPNQAPVMVMPYDRSASRINGRIVGQDPVRDLLYVALDNIVYGYDLPAHLVVDRAYLLYELAESIGALEEVPPLGRVFFEPDHAGAITIANTDSQQVAAMLSRLKPPWTRFLWGPPGSGKTHALACLMLHLIDRHPGERILLVAPSNVAVDVALHQFVTLLERRGKGHLVTARRILRYGYPRKSEILSRTELLGSVEQEELSLQISSLSAKIQAAARKDRVEEDQLALLRAEQLDLQEQLRKLVVAHIRQCLVVATTTTQAYMSTNSFLHEDWDSMLIDEVTMVPPAVCLFMSSLAGKRFLLAGDPRQLGPVYENSSVEDKETLYWMGEDTYDFAGLSTGNGERRRIQIRDARLARITSQRRCIPEIWRAIEHLYEGVQITVDESRVGFLRHLPPGSGQGIAIVDTGTAVAGAICEKASNSWQNQETARLGIQFAQTIVERVGTHDVHASVAIITPYRAQHKLIRQLLRENQLEHQIEAGTIHQFQGSEADVVIFDVVDGPGRTRLGKLLRGDTGLRLVNVAISRARGKLIVLADVNWFRRALKRSDNSILWDLLIRRAADRRL